MILTIAPDKLQIIGSSIFPVACSTFSVFTCIKTNKEKTVVIKRYKAPFSTIYKESE